MLSLFHSKKDGINLVIDIGSYSLAGALVFFAKDKTPQIIFSKRISLPLNHDRDKDKTIIAIANNLEYLFKIMFEESTHKLGVKQKKLKNQKIKKILCVVSSPWSRSVIKTSSYKKDAPVHVNSKLMELIEKNDQNSKEAETDYGLIEKKIIQTKLNGYVTNNPLYKKAKEIEISTFEGKILKEMVEKVFSSSGRLSSGNVIFHSFTLSAFSTIGDIFGDEDYLLMEVTGEMTELTFIKNGSIVKTDFFSSGKNLFLRKISEEFDVDSDISLSFIKLYYERKSEKNFRNRIEEIVRQAEMEWFNQFRESIKSIKESMPQKIFLSMDSALSPFFTEFLNSEICKLGKKTDIVSLNVSSLSQFCDINDNDDDSFLALETIFFDKIQEK